MVVTNLITGANPRVLHRNGNPANWRLEWERVVSAFFNEPRPNDPPCDDITILTWNSRPAKGVLERCLDWRGVPYVTLGSTLESWRNCYKIFLTADALTRVTSRYVMALDADDVLVLSPLCDILEIYREFNCDIVFGAEKQSWPDVPSLARFDRSIAESAYCHLNSGAWIGRTDAALRFFRECQHEDVGEVLKGKTNMTSLYDDQGLTRMTFRRHYPHVRLDYQCRLFQSLFKVPTSGEVQIQFARNAA